MNLAVMQPYLFPYIGYFQLIYVSDVFLIYDDVSYIKQGFINRNTILSKSGPVRFTVAVPGASSNKLISSLSFSPDVKKQLESIKQNYSKRPYFTDVFPMISEILLYEDRDIANLVEKSFVDICKYIGLDRNFIKTSTLDYDRAIPAKDRLIAFCNKFNAKHYINSPNGKALYKKEDFNKQGVKLSFLDVKQIEYEQGQPEFVPNLSIIDVLMNCSPTEIKFFLERSFYY